MYNLFFTPTVNLIKILNVIAFSQHNRIKSNNNWSGKWLKSDHTLNNTNIESITVHQRRCRRRHGPESPSWRGYRSRSCRRATRHRTRRPWSWTMRGSFLSGPCGPTRQSRARRRRPWTRSPSTDRVLQGRGGCDWAARVSPRVHPCGLCRRDGNRALAWVPFPFLQQRCETERDRWWWRRGYLCREHLERCRFGGDVAADILSRWSNWSN